MSGWEQPTPPTPDGPPAASYWTRPSSSDPLRPIRLIRHATGLYRSSGRRFLLVALGPELIRDVLGLPSLLIAGLTFRGMFQVMADVFGRIAEDPEAYRYTDQQAFQDQVNAQLRAAMLIAPDLGVLSAIGTGAGIVVALIGSAAITAAALGAIAGQPVSVASAFRLVAARGAFLTSFVAIGVVWGVIAGLSYLSQSAAFQEWVGVPGSPRSGLFDGLFGVASAVVAIAFIVLVLRWALYLPAVLVEGLGVGPGLARSVQLTHGIRIRLALATVGIILLQAISVGIVATALGSVLWFAASSVELGIAGFLIATLAGNLLWAPFVPAMLAIVYRERTRSPEASPAMPE